jgi:site-specific DNA-adenine methylase
MWNFPVNPQRDIKQFQVFRRKSVKEPFAVLKVYDFDDSQIKSHNYEEIFPFLVDELSSPQTFYDDFEFDRESSFIYGVCCVDAHGFSSNLSMQFEISFNKYKNQLVKKLISTSGAPKAYPNLYLLQDAFVDVIKDSGHSRATVYFDPEYLNVFNSNGEDLGLLATNRRDGKYKLQFINTDLQQAQVLDIIINDLRLTRENG